MHAGSQRITRIRGDSSMRGEHNLKPRTAPCFKIQNTRMSRIVQHQRSTCDICKYACKSAHMLLERLKLAYS